MKSQFIRVAGIAFVIGLASSLPASAAIDLTESYVSANLATAPVGAPVTLSGAFFLDPDPSDTNAQFAGGNVTISDIYGLEIVISIPMGGTEFDFSRSVTAAIPGTDTFFTTILADYSESNGTLRADTLSSETLLTEVHFTAVPEPATWAMFLLGFGAIGWTLRERRNASAAAA